MSPPLSISSLPMFSSSLCFSTTILQTKHGRKRSRFCTIAATSPLHDASFLVIRHFLSLRPLRYADMFLLLVPVLTASSQCPHHQGHCPQYLHHCPALSEDGCPSRQIIAQCQYESRVPSKTPLTRHTTLPRLRHLGVTQVIRHANLSSGWASRHKRRCGA